MDTATGIYYCVANDTSVPDNCQGLFYSPNAEQFISLLDKDGSAAGANGKVFISSGRRLWSGAWHRSLPVAHLLACHRNTLCRPVIDQHNSQPY